MTIDIWTGIVAVIVCLLLAALILVGLAGRRSWGYVGACAVGVGILGLILIDPITFFTNVWTWGERMIDNDPTLYGTNS